MLPGKCLHRDSGGLSAISDLTHELGREECQAEQPGHFRLVDAFAISDFGQWFDVAFFDPVPPKMGLGDGLDEAGILPAKDIAVL